jgi:hypothetical protein
VRTHKLSLRRGAELLHMTYREFLALACGHIEVQRNIYLIVDPWLTMARQGGVTAALAEEAEGEEDDDHPDL